MSPLTERQCLEPTGEPDESNNCLLFMLAGCSHHSRLNHTAQVADRLRDECVLNARGGGGGMI